MDRFRAVTFNIHHGRGRDGRVDLERTARVLRELRPDLVALQELDVGVSRSDFVDQPHELGRMLDMAVRFFPTVNLGAGSYGIALAARVPLDCVVKALPRMSDEEPRIAVVATWREMSVVATHLAKSADARRAQTTYVVQLVQELPTPRLLIGDLNQPRHQLSVLTEAGLRLVVPRKPLLWWLRPRTIVDHIAADAALRAADARIVLTSASDHSALVADFEVS